MINGRQFKTSRAVGDFGLAISNLAKVDPSDVSRHPTVPDADMTLGSFLLIFYLVIWLTASLDVGTAPYIAPEVQSRKRGPRNHLKADMYSLGVSGALFLSFYFFLIFHGMRTPRRPLDRILRDESPFFYWVGTNYGPRRS